MNEDDRKAFELWASDGGKYPKAVTRSSVGGGYMLGQTATSWLAWQAALASERAAVKPVAEAILRACQDEPHLQRILSDAGILDWAERTAGVTRGGI